LAISVSLFSLQKLGCLLFCCFSLHFWRQIFLIIWKVATQSIPSFIKKSEKIRNTIWHPLFYGIPPFPNSSLLPSVTGQLVNIAKGKEKTKPLIDK
jgi:hypothetical protein